MVSCDQRAWVDRIVEFRFEKTCRNICTDLCDVENIVLNYNVCTSWYIRGECFEMLQCVVEKI